MEYLDMVQTGFSEAGGWVVVMMMWIAAFGGIMRLMHAFKPVSDSFFNKNFWKCKTVNVLQCGLSLLGNAALADEMAQIVTIGPIIKDMVEENVEGSKDDLYVLKLRNATFSAQWGYGSQLIPLARL